MTDELITAENFANFPDDAYRHELSCGFVLAEPFPSPRHDRVRQKLERLLVAFVESRGLGEIFGHTGYILARDPDTVRGPDLSFVSKERLVGLDDVQFFAGAPDLAVEILSPSNRSGEMHAKVADYLAAGARMVWVIDPGRRLVTTYRELLAPRRIAPPTELDGEDVLPGLTISLDAFLP